jgi:glycosyltransferase involved in cell wall biosynthesis
MNSDHQMPQELRVCFFGTYDSQYPGNRVLIEGLRLNEVEVVECHVALWEKTRVKEGGYFGPLSLVRLAGQYVLAMARLLARVVGIPRCSVIVAGFNGYLDLPAARAVALVWRAQLVFNPMMSLYDTLVIDRRRFRPGTLAARLILCLERMLYKLPDAMLVDTKVHFQFFADELRCPWDKFRQLSFGVDDSVFQPRPRVESGDLVRVLFYGKYQPLQGVVHIVEAAKILEGDPGVSFLVIGRGPTWPEVQRRSRELRVANVQFVEWVDFHSLPDVIARADICLGIFGASGKVERCVSNKVLQAMAMGKPVISGYTKAMGEVLSDGEGVVFCELGSPEDLARAIISLKDSSLREEIGRRGYEAFLARFSPVSVGADAKRHLQKLVSSTLSG